MDIRGFTEFSEQLSPDQIAGFLSDFREIMINAIFEYGGTIDKFIGDAIMATFGTPAPSPEYGRDSQNALSAALQMIDNLDKFNNKRIKNSYKPVDIGIALHTGIVFSGNIKAGEYLEYTVIGDVVNTASRIETLCKEFSCRFLISEEVFAEVNQFVKTEKMPLTNVKGKSQPLQVYKVI